jgi:hypothetical protein
VTAFAERVWIHPHTRRGKRVRGYWRNVDSLRAPEVEAAGRGRPDVRFAQTTDYERFNEAVRANPRREFLSELTPLELAQARVFLSEDGKAGFVLSPEGDLQNVFRNPGGKPGAGRAAVDEAVQMGAKTLDAYDGFLPHMYEEAGFREVGRMKFDPGLAPDGWDAERYDSPDIVFMGFGAEERSGTARYFTDWDEAKAASLEAYKVGQAYRPWTGGGIFDPEMAWVHPRVYFDPHQPRWSKGTIWGGRWRGGARVTGGGRAEVSPWSPEARRRWVTPPWGGDRALADVLRKGGYSFETRGRPRVGPAEGAVQGRGITFDPSQLAAQMRARQPLRGSYLFQGYRFNVVGDTWRERVPQLAEIAASALRRGDRARADAAHELAHRIKVRNQRRVTAEEVVDARAAIAGPKLSAPGLDNSIRRLAVPAEVPEVREYGGTQGFYYGGDGRDGLVFMAAKPWVVQRKGRPQPVWKLVWDPDVDDYRIWFPDDRGDPEHAFVREAEGIDEFGASDDLAGYGMEVDPAVLEWVHERARIRAAQIRSDFERDPYSADQYGYLQSTLEEMTDEELEADVFDDLQRQIQQILRGHRDDMKDALAMGGEVEATVYADWDPRAHPRYPKGVKEGGRFRPGWEQRMRAALQRSATTEHTDEWIEAVIAEARKRKRPGLWTPKQWKGGRIPRHAGPPTPEEAFWSANPLIPPAMRTIPPGRGRWSEAFPEFGRIQERSAGRIRSGEEWISWPDVKANPPEGIRVFRGTPHWQQRGTLEDLPEVPMLAVKDPERGSADEVAFKLDVVSPELLEEAGQEGLPPEMFGEPVTVFVPKNAKMPTAAMGQEAVRPRARKRPVKLPPGDPLDQLPDDARVIHAEAQEALGRASTPDEFKHWAANYVPRVAVNMEGIVFDWDAPGSPRLDAAERLEREEQARGIMGALLDYSYRFPETFSSKSVVFDFVGTYRDARAGVVLGPVDEQAWALTAGTTLALEREPEIDRAVILVNPDIRMWRSTGEAAGKGMLAPADASAYGRMTHELGHAHMQALGIDSPNEQAAVFNAFVESLNAVDLSPEEMSGLSYYAAGEMMRGNAHEMYAEIFTTLYSPGSLESLPEHLRTKVLKVRDEMNARYGRRLL